MKVEIDIETLSSGRYSVVIMTDNGPTVGDGLTVEGVVKAVSLAVVDVLGECVDVGSLSLIG